MDKIPTAQEFLLSKSWNTSHAEIKLMTLALIEFAQLHSEAALKAVAQELMVEPSSILNAYPKELIK